MFSKDEELALGRLILQQLATMRAADSTVERFVAAHLDDAEVMASVLMAASEKLALTLQDGQGHSWGFHGPATADERFIYFLNVSTVPFPAHQASFWFGREWGGYAGYLDRYYQMRGKDLKDFRVFVHFIFGCDLVTPPGIWAAHGLFSFGEPHVRWIFPADCLTEKDKARISELEARHVAG